MMLRRSGILLKPLEYNIETITKIIYNCASLHNRCVDRWMSKRGPLQPLKHSNDARIFCAHTDIAADEDDFPCDETVRNQFRNQFQDDIPPRVVLCSRRDILKEHIYNCCIRFDNLADIEFEYDAEIDHV